MIKTITATTQIEATLEALSRQQHGRSRKSPICVTCGTDKVKPEMFRDNKSRREWELSRMCQGCQDDFYSEE